MKGDDGVTRAIPTGDLQVPVRARDHVQGPDTAPVTLLEYADYECPYSRIAYSVIKGVQRQLGDQLRFVYRNFPLREIHPHAQHAAEAAEAAANQGRFWEMHDHLSSISVLLMMSISISTPPLSVSRPRSSIRTWHNTASQRGSSVTCATAFRVTSQGPPPSSSMMFAMKAGPIWSLC
jgi:hypothetical protein